MHLFILFYFILLTFQLLSIDIIIFTRQTGRNCEKNPITYVDIVANLPFNLYTFVLASIFAIPFHTKLFIFPFPLDEMLKHFVLHWFKVAHITYRQITTPKHTYIGHTLGKYDQTEVLLTQKKSKLECLQLFELGKWARYRCAFDPNRTYSLAFLRSIER